MKSETSKFGRNKKIVIGIVTIIAIIGIVSAATSQSQPSVPAPSYIQQEKVQQAQYIAQNYKNIQTAYAQSIDPCPEGYFLGMSGRCEERGTDDSTPSQDTLDLVMNDFVIRMDIPAGWAQDVDASREDPIQIADPNSDGGILIRFGLTDDPRSAEQASLDSNEASSNELTDFELIESGPTTVAGFPAYQSISTFVDSGSQERVKSLKVLLKEGEHFFELEYVSSLDTFDQSLPQVQESINSLQLEML